MQTDPSPSTEAGSVAGLWRYPVKSMMGEELNAAEVTDRGLIGDRRFAVVDASTGKVAGAKNPRKWGNFFDFRAAYIEPPKRGSKLPPVRLTLPDGTVVTSDRIWHRFCRERLAAKCPSTRRSTTKTRRAPRRRSTGRIWRVWTTGIR